MNIKKDVIDVVTKLVDDGIEQQKKVNNALCMSLDILELVQKYTEKHELALSVGSEWLFQDDRGQVDALDLVGKILDRLVECNDTENEEEEVYWRYRCKGLDLCGFVNSKSDGEKILKMVQDVLKKEETHTFLDYRDFEPNWIQFKFQKDEFNLNKLLNMIQENNSKVNKIILEACRL